MKVLVIEDEIDIREMLVSQFRDSGVEADGMENALDLAAKLDQIRPNVILLDQMMPGKSGADVIREVRADARFCETPIMMVTGLSSEEDKVRALEMGADDYVTKPFSIREVVARAQALVRRAELAHKSQQNNISVKDLSIDLKAHKVTLCGTEIALTLTEFRILTELLRQSGQVLTRDKLRERALGNLNVTDRTIDVHMASLRKKLGNTGDAIETVRGVGYRMIM
jgi:two-component system alkaline phosphatase synthesis response regulator PhoP